MQELDVVVLVFVELTRRNFVAAGLIPPLRVEVATQLGVFEAAAVTCIDGIFEHANLSFVQISDVVVCHIAC